MDAAKRDRLSALLIGLLLFAYRLSTLGAAPKGFYCDEASILYNAWSIAETGRDEHGVFFPLAFRAFGDFKSGPYIYLVALATKLFGVTPFAARLPSAMLLLSTQALGFLLLARFFSARCGLIFVALIATQQWFHHFSHVAFQLTVEPLFLMALLYSLLALVETDRLRWSACAALSALAAWWSYSPAHLFVPLASAFALCIYWTRLCALPRVGQHLALFSALVGIGVGYCLLWVCNNPDYLKPAETVSILVGGGYQQTAAYAEFTKPTSWFAGWAHDGIPFRMLLIFRIYLGYLAPEFLFTSTGYNFLYGTPDYGFYGPALAVGILASLYRLVTMREPFLRMLLCWILLAPLPAALTWMNHPHPARAMLFQPAMDLFGAIGLWQVALWCGAHTRFAPWIARAVLLAAVSGQARYYINYSRHFSQNFTNFSAPLFQFEYQRLIPYLQRHGAEYEQVVFVSRRMYYEPQIFALLYSGLAPERWLAERRLPWNLQNAQELPAELKPHTLYVIPVPPQNLPRQLEVVESFTWGVSPSDRIALMRLQASRSQ